MEHSPLGTRHGTTVTEKIGQEIIDEPRELGRWRSSMRDNGTREWLGTILHEARHEAEVIQFLALSL
jgi:hypothetical protein